MRNTSAKRRMDGEQTRIALIEAAGELAAEYGWAHVQAKQVCERAQVNVASINYWFGSRDALYEAVVAEIPDALIEEMFFQQLLLQSDKELALSQFLDRLLGIISLKGRTWPLRVWVREVTGTPSEAFLALINQRGVIRFDAIKTFVGSYLGLDHHDIRVNAAIMHIMAVILLMLTVSPRVQHVLYPNVAEEFPAYIKALKMQLALSLSAMKTSIQKERESCISSKVDKEEDQ